MNDKSYVSLWNDFGFTKTDIKHTKKYKNTIT